MSGRNTSDFLPTVDRVCRLSSCSVLSIEYLKKPFVKIAPRRLHLTEYTAVYTRRLQKSGKASRAPAVGRAKGLRPPQAQKR